MRISEDNNLAYEVIRSGRATTDIIIERDGRIVVRAPQWADDDLIADIIQSKQYWIFQGLAEWRDLNATRVLLEYRNGEGFLYLGRSYRLLLVNDQKAPLLLKEGRFRLLRDLVEQGEVSAVKAAFMDFYTTKGLERLCARVAYFAPKIGVEPKDVEVRELGHRWASCSPQGRLAFHWKCTMAPQTIIDYIVVHELCHFHQADHTDAFWNEVDKVMPDFWERKEWLRKNGAGLDV